MCLTMNSQLALIVLIATTVLAAGCHWSEGAAEESSSVSNTQPETPHATSGTEPEMPTLEPIADAAEVTEDSLHGIEQKYACHLPSDYRAFLLAHNGAFPSPACVTFKEAGRLTTSDVFCFFAMDDARDWASLEWHEETYRERLPKSTLPIGRDSCGNLWLLSLRRDDAGSIFFWDHGSYDTFDETDLEHWPKLAPSFTAFLGTLSPFNAAAEDGVPSRYSLVKQAEEGMVKRDPSFSTRANPEYVWHCDCDGEGKVRMQFVQYDKHAIFTHTCGYSRLRALKGLIQGGRTRLPEQ
jgi:hypothetical protein